MFGWATTIDLPSLIIGAALGAAFGALTSTWHSYYVRRPKLQVTGGGGGGGPHSLHTRHITIRNSPGLLGLKLPETTILGIHIHRNIEMGLVVDRNPAHQCRALLYDKETNHPIKPLWWRTSDGKMTQEVTLKSGEQASLMLFARLGDEPRKYFVYQLDSSESNESRVPDDEDKFDTTREFYIDIRHSYGKKRVRIECTMTKGFDGRLQFRSKGGGGSF